MSLRLDAIRITHAGRPVLDGFTLALAPGEVVTLMGPSGIGKSSLLAYACGLLPHGLRGSGEISVDGRAVTRLPPHRRGIGILFQDDLLFPHLNVADNLLFGLHPDTRGRAARHAAMAAALGEAELPGIERRDPQSLSGGQRARVLLMRVLLSRPRVLLLDEPFGGLDGPLRDRFRNWVLAAAAARSLPVLLVTHDPAEAAGRVVRLQA